MFEMSAAALSPPVPKPDHVLDKFVYDFDVRNDPALVADPHERVLDLHRSAPPVFWTPRNGGHWVTVSHSANFNAARDVETFSSEIIPHAQIEAMMAMRPAGSPHIPLAVPIGMDPPTHTKYRIPLNGAFSPKAMKGLNDEIRTLANELIDRMAPRGKCEFMAEVAEVLPVQVFLKMLGLPLERMQQYRALVKEFMLATTETDVMKIAALQRKVADGMRDMIDARQSDPKDDLISLMWNIKFDGTPTTVEDIENYGVLLFIAGLDTVMNGMGFGVRHLARDLPLQRQLREHPEQVGDATEELLRRYTFTVPMRRVAKDTEFQGVPMKSGDRLMLFLPGADLDPVEYPEPEKINMNRERVHIAFNAGPHRCLGSHLARIELQILYEQMLSRLPEFRLDPEHTPTFHGGNVIGVDTLHLVWTP
jgi:cytochrome P450